MSTLWKREYILTSNNLQILFKFFFFLFENIVDSSLNQSRNTREKREFPTLQTKRTYNFLYKTFINCVNNLIRLI